jgi:hypothetical protein
MNDSKVIELFDLLDKWRYFPAYQLERRADIFFAIFLKQIIQNRFNLSIDTVIPEFPVRVGAIIEKEINKSFKIDYVAVNQKMKEVFLVELKTDLLSRREKQDWYLKRAQEINIHGLVDGLIKIFNATNQKSKYMYLLNDIEVLGWIEMSGSIIKNTSERYNVKILYIQPEKHSEESSDVVTFDEIISVIKPNADALSIRFAESLERWKVNPNTAETV